MWQAWQVASVISACDCADALKVLVFLFIHAGVSMLDAPDMQFHDPEATGALHATLETEVIRSSARQVVRVPHHINDPEFADAAAAQFVRMMGESASAAGEAGVPCWV